MSIIIGADLVPTANNQELFARAEIDELLGSELTKILLEADYRIFNLEVPLTDQEQPIPKCGPNLIAPTICVAGYKAMHVDLLTLANNHILDQDQQGLASTCSMLDAAGIAYTGVGKTPEEAARPYIFECNGKRIGVYACVEHEFSIVTDYSAGANPIDLLESPDHIASLKAECDFVIVLYHGGKEHYRYPSPNLQKICRKLVEKGADLVVCQHSHCIGCEEKYLDGTIVYGQGNFLFDRSNNEFWKTGLLIEIREDGLIDYIPIVKQNHTVRLAKASEQEDILSNFHKRSQEIKNPRIIEEKYNEYAKSMQGFYYLVASGIEDNIVLRIINRLSGDSFYDWYLKKKYSKKKKIALRNILECEAHDELFLHILRK